MCIKLYQSVKVLHNPEQRVVSNLYQLMPAVGPKLERHHSYDIAHRCHIPFPKMTSLSSEADIERAGKRRSTPREIVLSMQV